MRAYPLAVRHQVIALLAAGQAVVRVAQTVQVAPRTVRRWRQRWQAEHDLTPCHSPGRPPCIGPAAAPRLFEVVRQHPTATLRELCAAWQATTGQQLSSPTMCRTLQRLGVTRQRRPSTSARS